MEESAWAKQPWRPSVLPKDLSEWLTGRVDADPNAAPSELLVTLIRGGLRPRSDYDAVLDLLVETLPQLRGGLRPESAEFTARLLVERLNVDAAAIASRERLLSFVGLGADHHLSGNRPLTAITRRALETGEALSSHDRAGIGCARARCPLTSAIVVPLVVRGTVAGAIALYNSPERLLIERDEKIARDLARVFSVYLELAELDRLAALVTRAELEALRAQISPHFLFNTLTTIAAMTRVDAEHAHDLIVQFAELFRDTLSQRREVVSLADELNYVERYLRFEKIRFGERLTVEQDVDPRALGAFVPVLAIQPLVENALGHGIAPKRGHGRVRISAVASEDGFEIGVSDDGVGIPKAHCRHILERGNGSDLGVALHNIHQRLVGLFGPASGLRIESRRNAGTSVRFWLPMRVPVRPAATP